MVIKLFGLTHDASHSIPPQLLHGGEGVDWACYMFMTSRIRTAISLCFTYNVTTVMSSMMTGSSGLTLYFNINPRCITYNKLLTFNYYLIMREGLNVC